MLLFASHTFHIVWMKALTKIELLPLFNRKTAELEDGLVGIQTASVAPEHKQKLWCGVQNLTELHFLFPDFVFRLLPPGGIYSCPDKFYEVARLVQDRMPDRMEVLDSSIGKYNSVLHVKVGAFGRPFRKSFSAHPISIFGMNALEKRFVRR